MKEVMPVSSGVVFTHSPQQTPNTLQRQVRERDIEAYLVRRVKAFGGEVRKVKWIGRRFAPDRVVMLPSQVIDNGFMQPTDRSEARTIWVELKAPGEKPTSGQLREHSRMRAIGQWVEVIDSFEGADALLS